MFLITLYISCISSSILFSFSSVSSSESSFDVFDASSITLSALFDSSFRSSLNEMTIFCNVE
ncbi:hypothetical protein ECANGB1_2614 [Enterospora canceri]|uniref:Secreted protein n=1 Tax=Enterospora canceri TaxID=1081671 RepID=A0A1Y1S9H0_9MICR|nr:hypothetical protein ECANGB1_2614 [Enterospora canceri]